MDLFLGLHLVQGRGPLRRRLLVRFVDAVAGCALGAVQPLAARHRPRGRAAARGHKQRDDHGDSHKLKPSTERTKVAPELSPRPKPAPSWTQIRLEAQEIEGPA